MGDGDRAAVLGLERDWEAGRPVLRPKWPAGLLSLPHSFDFFKQRTKRKEKGQRRRLKKNLDKR